MIGSDGDAANRIKTTNNDTHYNRDIFHDNDNNTLGM